MPEGFPTDWNALVREAQRQCSVRSAELLDFVMSLPPEAHVGGAFAAGVGVGLLLPRLRQPFRRFATADDIPLRFFREQRRLRVVGVSASDGDTFRARHAPLGRPSAFVGRAAEHTLQVRLAAVDTPETPKFGNAGQPFGDEAKQWLARRIEGKTLTLTLLHKDQYARAVCMVEYGVWPFRRNVSEEILKVGLAHVYRQAGAVYGGRQEVFESLEAQAKSKKLGIWSQGRSFESSGEYKARLRAAK